jgi:glycine cleavage system aminomethyltransferase T
VGFLTSGGYGHALGGAIGLGYVPCTAPGEPSADMKASAYQIEIAGRRYGAEVSLAPMYDPKSERVKI